MPFTLPVSINYPSPLTPIPANWHKEPLEGKSQIGGEIDWSTMGGADKTVAFNVGGNAAAPFSKVSAISVDNSQSGSDVTFIFPDTGQTIPVPAYQAGTYPVFTSGTQFYVSAPNALNVDKTTFVIHNSVPPNFSIPKTEFQASAVASGVPFANGTTQLIPANITGSLSGMNVGYQNGNTVLGGASISLEDGTGNLIGFYSWQSTNPGALSLTDQTNIQVRFTNGVKAIVGISGAPAGTFFVNLLYRTP